MFFNNNRERHIIRLVCMVTMVGFLVAVNGLFKLSHFRS